MEHTTSLFWFVVSLCAGGAIIALGLILEFFKGGIKRFGEILVLGGIIFETVVAGLTAKEQWKLIQFARQNDPEKRHIVSIEARVELEVHSKTNEIFNLRHISLDFVVNPKKDENPKLGGPIALLTTNGAVFPSGDQKNGYAAWIEAHLSAERFGNVPISMPDYEVQDLNTNVQVHLSGNFVRLGNEITGGVITLFVNSSVVKYYKIPHIIIKEEGDVPFIASTVENPWDTKNP